MSFTAELPNSDVVGGWSSERVVEAASGLDAEL